MRDYEILLTILPCRLVKWRKPTGPLELVTSVPRSEIVFVWFAAGPAATAAFVLSRIFHKKIVVVAGGSEVSPEKEIHGSGIRSAIRFLTTRIILNNSDLVIAVSYFNKTEILAVSKPKRLNVVYNGIDTNEYRPSGDGKIFDGLTVAAGRNRAQFTRKGLDRFAQLARCLPTRRFVAVGNLPARREWKRRFPRNVQITGPVPNDILLYYFQKSRFYCQLSRHEQFGVALVEAMATGCVPIVSDSGALPEVVGPCGIVVRNGDPLVASTAIEEFRSHCEELGNLTRKRVQTLYSIEERKMRFKEILNQLLCNTL